METGKVEYAPDYKSQVELAMDEGRRIAESIIANNKLSAEHARLKDAVLKACRAEHLADAIFTSGRYRAVKALIAFEAEHKIGETNDNAT